MTTGLIQYAFVSGEISPQLMGRSDLEKYDLGLAEARNFFVDYRGGITTRPGTEFVGWVWRDDRPVRMFPFRFAPGVEDTYILLFGHQYIRFIQAGGYVIEANKTITNVSKADPAVVASTAHGYDTGDWVQITGVGGMDEVNTRVFSINVPGVNTFELFYAYAPLTISVDSTNFTAYTSGGQANRIYTLDTPYQDDHIKDLKVHQTRDLVRITHPSYAPRNLIRNGHTDWVLEEEVIGTSAVRPSKPTITPSNTGNAGALWVVTGVGFDGNESLPSDRGFMTNSVNYTQEDGSASVRWDVQPDVSYYNVYRSRITRSARVTQSMEVGFVGQAFGAHFVDSNIIADFTATPPQHFDPFADARITHINVTAQGTGYARAAGVTVNSGTGTGFVGFPVIDETGGGVLAVIVINGGQGYTTGDTVVITGGGGTGATFDIFVNATGGNFPATSTIFQQRQIYAGTNNQPLTIWGSRPGRFSNFDFSRIVLDSDSYEFDLDSEEVAQIEHLLPTRLGLLVFSASGIWLLHGGDQEAVTPTNAVVIPQTKFGAAPVPPLEIESDILYVEGKGSIVRLLEYSELRKVFSGINVIILSNHLITPMNRVVKWAYASDPHKIVWCVREDGKMLAFTLEKEQQVYAWTVCSTRGLVRDVEVVREGDIDATYIVVDRPWVTALDQGTRVHTVERLARKDFKVVDEAWAVDRGKELPKLFQNTQLRIGGNTIGATVTIFTVPRGQSFFVAGDVGKMVNGNTGKAEITSFIAGDQVQATILRQFEVRPEDPDERPEDLLANEWTMRQPVSTMSRLWDWEGLEVSILADGLVQPNQTVTDGQITLNPPAVIAQIGVPFTARAKTLPPTVRDTVIEHRRKDIVGLAVRVHDTRGLKVGATLDKMYPVREFGAPTEFQQGYEVTLVAAQWDDEGQTYMVQDQPLPATILGVVKEVDVGDDPDFRG